MRDQRPHLLGVPGHQGERVDRATTAGEQVDRPADLLDDPMQVISIDVRRYRSRGILQLAPLGATRIVGHDAASAREAVQRRPVIQRERSNHDFLAAARHTVVEAHAIW